MKSKVTVKDVAIVLFCLAVLKAVFELIAPGKNVERRNEGNSSLA
jgi:uncharacterized membrane protein YjfL (UPF0719 family)